MAGDWIKMRTNLDTDPRVLEMAATLGVTELQVVGMLWKVWSWADAHTLDGNAIRVTSVTLDRFTCCNGFADALRKVGWLDGRDNAITFPRFAEHNGQTAKKRAETKERVAKHRNAKGVTDVTQKALPEKRREEKRRDNKKLGMHAGNEKFDEAFEAFVSQSIGNHNWPCDENTQLAWRYELDRYPIEDAIGMLWYSTQKGAKSPIMNGDHRRALITTSNQGQGRRFGRKTDQELFGDE